MNNTKLDANDLLKRWNAEGLDTAAQRAMIQGMVAVSQPLIERMAEEAGILREGVTEDEAWSQEYETAMEAVVALALTLDESTLGRYKNKLARKMRMLTRDFNNALAGKKKDGKKKKENEIPEIATLGGWYREGEALYFVDCYLDYDGNRTYLTWRDPQGNVKSGQELLLNNNGYQFKLVPVDPDDEPMIKVQDGQEMATVVMPPGVHDQPVELNEVLQDVFQFIKRQYLFDEERTPFIISIVIINSWVYENFRTLCYLRALGDAGAGKSELMRRAGHLCYRLTKVSGADSEPVFFRTTELFRGTIFTEEADMEQSGASSAIMKFYNMGAMDGNTVSRMEEWINPKTGTKTFRTRPFRTFCPKLFCQREEFDDLAVKSRSLDIRVVGKSSLELKKTGIPLEMNGNYWSGWRRIMPKLMRLRMQYAEFGKIDQDMDLIDIEISARLNQVTMPIRLLAQKSGDAKLLSQITDVLREQYREETAEKSQETEARVVEALWKMYTYPDLRQRMVIKDDGEIRVKIGDVTAITNNIIEEMKAEGAELRNAKPEGEESHGNKKKTYEIGTQRVGKILHNVIQLKKLAQRTNTGFYVVWDDVKMEVAGKKYGVLPEVEVIEKAREEMAKLRGKVDLTRAPLQMAIEMPEEPEFDPEWHNVYPS
jgi:hypothetical protein